MKLIMRGDDLGFSEAVNHGLLKAVKDGVITSVGLMVNMPASVHGFELLKNQDVALGLHTNICVGNPVGDPSKIPSLVDFNGAFCSSKTIRARQDDTIDVGECEIEIEAQLRKFQEITGKMPDYFEGHAVFSANFFTALANVAKCHQLFYVNPFDPKCGIQTKITGLPMAKMDPDNLYEPMAYVQAHLPAILENECSLLVFHPGYLDQFILDNSSYTLVRPKECEFLCSKALTDFLAANRIELVNFTNYRD